MRYHFLSKNETMTYLSSSIAVGVAIAALAGCGGGGNVTTPTALQTASSSGAVSAGSPTSGAGTLTLSFKVPASTTALAARKAQFVSPATQSVTVGVDGATPATATANCVSGTCTVSLNVAAGSHTLAVRLWDAANGGGNEVASNTATSCQVLPATANTCNAVLYGYPASISLTSTSSNVAGSQANGFTFGNGASTPFTVLVLDADGNAITGSGGITPSASSGTSFALATPAPGASPGAYAITDTDSSAQTIAFSATPAPNADGSTITAPVTFTGASQFAASLYYVNGSNLYVVSGTTGVQTGAFPTTVSGSPYIAATQGYALLNGATSSTLQFYDIATQSLAATVTSACQSSDNLPLAADNGSFYYSCGGTTYKYTTTGSLVTSWGDSGSSRIAAGGGYVYDLHASSVDVRSSSGTLLRTITLPPGTPSTWGISASSAGVFVNINSTTYEFDPTTGNQIAAINTGTLSCTESPNATTLTVRGGSAFKIFNIATGTQTGSFTVSPSPQDCRVGYSN